MPVAEPAAGTAAHTLYWYSRDSKGNTEATKSVSFSVLAGRDFLYSGSAQSFVVPAGVTSISLTMKGGSGGNSVHVGGTYSIGGAGGGVSAVIPVTPGSTLTVRTGAAGAACNPYGAFGSGGWPNGGNGNQYGGGGGGSSSVWLGSTVLAEAGGGGGGGSSTTVGAGGSGGSQGTLPGGYRTGTAATPYGAGGGAGGWNAGAGGSTTYRGGTGGTSYIAAGTGSLTPGANVGNGSVSIRYAVGASVYTLTYTAGANGTITGTSPQTVASGGSGTAVTAVANTGYHFVNWSDGITTATRTDTNVTANKSVTANFAVNTYTLTYTAGANGTITGTSPQTVNHNGSRHRGHGGRQHRLPLRELVRRHHDGDAYRHQRDGQQERDRQLRGQRQLHDHVLGGRRWLYLAGGRCECLRRLEPGVHDHAGQRLQHLAGAR